MVLQCALCHRQPAADCRFYDGLAVKRPSTILARLHSLFKVPSEYRLAQISNLILIASYTHGLYNPGGVVIVVFSLSLMVRRHILLIMNFGCLLLLKPFSL